MTQNQNQALTIHVSELIIKDQKYSQCECANLFFALLATVINKMATLYAEKVMSDIILVVGNAEYPSHKLILCASSDVFQIMLHDSNWSESSQKRIILGEVMKLCLQFL